MFYATEQSQDKTLGTQAVCEWHIINIFHTSLMIEIKEPYHHFWTVSPIVNQIFWSITNWYDIINIKFRIKREMLIHWPFIGYPWSSKNSYCSKHKITILNSLYFCSTTLTLLMFYIKMYMARYKIGKLLNKTNQKANNVLQDK